MNNINKQALKAYFQTGKIPTQAQFYELIDFFMPQPSDDAGQRSNQTLKFGQDDEIENPIINGLRTVHYKENDTNIYNFWIFTNYNVNDAGIAVPLFIMFRMSDSNPGIPSSNNKFRYYIPSELEVQSWVSQGVDCDRATDEELWNALQNFQYKDWPEGGGSSDNSNFKTCEIGTSKSAIFEVVEVLYNTKRIKIPVSIRFLSVGLSGIDKHSVWNLREDANIINVQNNWNNILANWKASNIYDLVIEFRNDCFVSGGWSLTINSVISEPGQYNTVAYGYDSTSLFTAFELTLAKDNNEHFIVGLLKQTEYIVANGQFRPKITWFSLAAKVVGNMPYYTGSKTFGDIVSFAKANLNSYTSEPNL
jgi:hypothetical protein